MQYGCNIHAIETKHGVRLAYESSYYQFSVKFLLCVYNLSFSRSHHLTSVWPPMESHEQQ